MWARSSVSGKLRAMRRKSLGVITCPPLPAILRTSIQETGETRNCWGILNYYTEEEHPGPQPSFETFVDFAMTGCLECRSIGIQGSLRCSQFAAHFKAPVLAVKRLLTWQ